jgi:hypothetical protein
MRRLTLILSDLYVPSEAAGTGAQPDALDLPNLDWLLRFAGRAERIEDWRRWLAAEVGRTDLAHLSLAHACSRNLLDESLASNAWLATPVHLEARIDHVRLADRGLLRLDAGERETWRKDFARAFGPDYALHDAGERCFLLSGAAAVRIASVDPSRLLDADIGRAVPGPSAGELRRLGTEIEMWLHGAPGNTTREQRRERRISALWLWGGGSRDVEAAAIAAIEVGPASPPRIFGGDPFLRAIKGSPVKSPPLSLSELAGSKGHDIVELAPMSGRKDESLSSLEANWFAPAREALRRGEIGSVDLVANDRRFRIAARSGWRWWRRRSSWLAQLSRPLL